MKIRKYWLPLLMLAAFKSAACTQDILNEIKPFSTSMSVGSSILVANQDKVLCATAYGKANLELSVPMSTKHLFEIGSLTKQFTSVAILLLAQEKKLSLDDDIASYISGITSAKGKVTIRHLLSHTSGLVDPINEPEFLATRVQEKISLKNLITMFKNERWLYPAGDRIQYSNVGYSMLAYIIEKVTGQPYSSFLSESIFKPLEMSNTYQASFSVIANKVTGYTYDGETPRQHDLLNLNWAYGAADLVSTTADLYKFTKALMLGDIINTQFLNILLAPVRLKDNTLIDGSFNYSLSKMGNNRAIRMSGSTLGYSSHSIYLPDNGIYIVVLSNSDGVNGGSWIPPATIAGKLATNILSPLLPD